MNRDKILEAIKDCYNSDFFGDMCMPCSSFMECMKLSLEEVIKNG